MRDEDAKFLLEALRRLHETIRHAVVEACEQSEIASLSEVALEEEGDTIYSVDRVSEELLVDFVESEIATLFPVILIAEGLPAGRVTLPRSVSDGEARYRIIVDPIDGTRALMYQKRSAWVLTGVAPNKGEDTNLSDIELAIQTEIPLNKQNLCDVVWARRGMGVGGERYDRSTGARIPIRVRPSASPTIAHGYASFVRFFPGVREEISAIDEEVTRAALGPPQAGKAQCFEDQYTSTGGQLYELMAGRDRFIADLRPLMDRAMRERGQALSICCHPYDLCTELIAREAGVVVVDPRGASLDAKLDVKPDVAWVGYANEGVRAQIEPALHEALLKRGIL